MKGRGAVGYVGDSPIPVSTASWAQTIDIVTVCVIRWALMGKPEGISGERS